MTQTDEFTEVRYETDGSVAVVSLAGGARRGALRPDTLDAIVSALDRAEADTSVRGVVLTGENRSFSVGLELTTPRSLEVLIAEDRRRTTEATGRPYQEPAGRVTLRMARMSIPVIAAVNGDAIGGGATIVTAADLRLCSENARFGFVFTRRGITPEGAATWFLPRLVGMGRAADWLLSGRVFDAEEALRAGFVTAIVPSERLLETALEHAHRFAAASPRAVAATRRLLARGVRAATAEQSAYLESQVLAEFSATADAAEGVRSFLERREPRFATTGREPLPAVLGTESPRPSEAECS